MAPPGLCAASREPSCLGLAGRDLRGLWLVWWERSHPPHPGGLTLGQGFSGLPHRECNVLELLGSGLASCSLLVLGSREQVDKALPSSSQETKLS